MTGSEATRRPRNQPALGRVLESIPTSAAERASTSAWATPAASVRLDLSGRVSALLIIACFVAGCHPWPALAKTGHLRVKRTSETLRYWRVPAPSSRSSRAALGPHRPGVVHPRHAAGAPRVPD